MIFPTADAIMKPDAQHIRMIHYQEVSMNTLSEHARGCLVVSDFIPTDGSEDVTAALQGLISLCRQAGAEVVGCGVVIEKAFQQGHALIEGMGVRVESLARVASMDPETGVTFLDD